VIPYYPVALDLRDRLCLVVGGGPVAEAKVEGLLAAGARVTVVSPELTESLAGWAIDGRIIHRPHRYPPMISTGSSSCSPRATSAR
jgi:Siroheme synthase (precorrin-2 oxidase/ferrochelatase domain)